MDVALLSAGSGWAVGMRGVILRWNGANWTAIAGPIAAILRGVHIASTTDGWIVGNDNTILRWNGSQWRAVASPVSDPFQIWMDVPASGNGAAIVGDLGLILQWNGEQWTAVTSPGRIDSRLNAVHMLSHSEGWTVGGANGGFAGYSLLYRYQQELGNLLYLPGLIKQ